MIYKNYKITNLINGKIYVGYTSKLLNERMKQHLSNFRKCILGDSIRKYGKENFTIESLYDFETEYEAKTTEIFLIAFHRTNMCRYPNGNGMNMTDGGEGMKGYKHSAKSNKKNSESNIGKKR